MMTWNSLLFQNPNTYLMELVNCMNDYVVLFMAMILCIVLCALCSVMKLKIFDLNFLEDHQLEMIWTVLPFILLMVVLLPSLTTLYTIDSCNFCGLTLKIVGHQWYWSYETCLDDSKIFDSYMLDQCNTQLRLLDVDNRAFLISNLPTRLLVGSADVIHSWTVPSFGFKIDAVPGRVNQFCVSAKRSGVFFGQCSEICGANHSFMPIVLESLGSKDLLKLA